MISKINCRRYFNKSRNISSRFISMLKKVGLLICNGESSDVDDEAHIVFSARDLTKSITGSTKIPPTASIPNANPKLGYNSKIGIPPHLRERPCLLSTHGLRRQSRSSASLEKGEETLHVLPMTVCTKHGVTSFLPLDYVKRMDEYTCTTRRHPVLEVKHTYDECVLEFPFPPPIGSSEEATLDIDFSKNCYQCFTPITERSTVFMFRYIKACMYFCCVVDRIFQMRKP